MKAIVWTEYGPPEGLHLEEVPTPSPREDEVRIRIHATTVAAGDCELRALRFSLGLRILVRLLMGITKPRPKILGQEFAGTVESVGSRARRFRVGDAVFGTTGFAFGAYAEYLCLPEDSRGRALALMPSNMTYEEAAAVPTGGLEAWHFLRRAGPLRGRRVLINGAGGGIGMFAVQLAKEFGAEVTAVDGAGKLEALRANGADHVIDYAREDFTQRGQTYDVIFDIAGSSSISGSMGALTDHGCYLLGNPGVGARLRGVWSSRKRGRRVIAGASRQPTEDLVFLRQLIETGRLRATIDRRFPLAQVPEAHRYVDTGAVGGKVVVTVVGDPAQGSPAVGGSEDESSTVDRHHRADGEAQERAGGVPGRE
ncbi:MAG: NAD(P)-dependent alcohol dehydrogenase, partial [Candidatus Lutacidiplasmatales archaeon]